MMSVTRSILESSFLLILYRQNNAICVRTPSKLISSHSKILKYVSQIKNLIKLQNERIKSHYEMDFSRLVGGKRASVYSWKYKVVQI